MLLSLYKKPTLPGPIDTASPHICPEIESSSISWAQHRVCFLPEDRGRVQSLKCCCKLRTGCWIMFKKSIIVLIYFDQEFRLIKEQMGQLHILRFIDLFYILYFLIVL
jgi:hypothetical protein